MRPHLTPNPAYRYGECMEVLQKAMQAQSYFGLNLGLDARYVMSPWDHPRDAKARENDHARTTTTGVAFVD